MKENIQLLNRHGITSWGLPWTLLLNKGLFLMDRDGKQVRGMYLLAPDDENVFLEKIKDTSLILTPDQRRELEKLAVKLSKWSKSIIRSAEDYAERLAQPLLSELVSFHEDFHIIISSAEYHNIFLMALAYTRIELKATSEEDDCVFTRYRDSENRPCCGAIYNAISARLFELVKKLCGIRAVYIDDYDGTEIMEC